MLVFGKTKLKGKNIFYLSKAKSLDECAKKLYLKLRQIKKLKYKIVPRDKYRPKRGTLNIDKAKRLIGFKPKFNLEKGTELYVKFIKKLKKTYL